MIENDNIDEFCDECDEWEIDEIREVNLKKASEMFDE